MIRRPPLTTPTFLYYFQAAVRKYSHTMFTFYLKHRNKTPPFLPSVFPSVSLWEVVPDSQLSSNGSLLCVMGSAEHLPKNRSCFICLPFHSSQ